MQHPRSLRPFLIAAALLSVCSTASLALAEGATNDPATDAVAAAPQGVVNLNTATEAELLRLPGIGPKKAQAILALRKEVKRFTRVEAIMRVKGIGRATFRKLRPMLTLDGATTLPGPTPRARAKR